jgi:Uma2 family endonuclease
MADRILEEKYVTEESLLALPSDARVEVICGEIVRMSPAGGLHHFICGNLHDPLKDCTRQGDALDAGALFPGLALPLTDIFALPDLRK